MIGAAQKAHLVQFFGLVHNRVSKSRKADGVLKDDGWKLFGVFDVVQFTKAGALAMGAGTE
ncbi:MAG: hypothetical protein KDJ36_05575 [Hyphomicrobiaceae bacterium]|nr:hypothetical protein [Hyphomicrobiaceae bacterium]